MTKGAGAFRDLARLRGGSEPRGGRPDHRQGAPGGRPVSLPPRRETRGRSQRQGVRRVPARLGWRWVRAARAAAGQRAWVPRGSTSRVPVVRWPRKGIAGPAWRCWQVPAQRGLSRQLPGVTTWPKRVAFSPAAPRSIPELSPGCTSAPSSPLVFQRGRSGPAQRASSPSHPPSVKGSRRVAEPAADRRASGFQVRGS